MRPHLLIATAASAALLMSGTAMAQSAAPSSDALPAATATGNATTDNGQPSGQAGSTDVTAPAASGPSSDSATVAPAAGAPAERASTATAGTDVVSNGPIPDTKANRTKYGMPMSNAGRMSKASGN